jgi:hypothetical protein
MKRKLRITRLTGLQDDDNDLFSFRGNVDVPVNGLFSYFTVVIVVTVEVLRCCC